jgi:hypothetical protein
MQVMDPDASSSRSEYCFKVSLVEIMIPQMWMRDEGGLDTSSDIRVGLYENDLIISPLLLSVARNKKSKSKSKCFFLKKSSKILFYRTYIKICIRSGINYRFSGVG